MKALTLTLTVLLLATPAALARPILPDLDDLCDNVLCDECPLDGSCELPDPRALPAPGPRDIPCFGPYACELPLP